MENVTDELSETPKALPICKIRSVKSVGLRRRTPRNDSSLTPLATTNAMANSIAAKIAARKDPSKEPLAPKNLENDSDESRESNDNTSFLMSSVDWDLLDAETTKEAETMANPLPGLDEVSFNSLSSSMLTPGEDLKPLEIDKLNTLERCTLLPANGAKIEDLSPAAEDQSKKPGGKINNSLPKKLFDLEDQNIIEDQNSIDDTELRKSPIITYKRRIPQSRNLKLKSDKRLKPSSPLKHLLPPSVAFPSSCSTPLSVKSKPLILPQSPISDSGDEDSFLLEMCNQIEQSASKESSCVAASSSSCSMVKPPDKKKSDPSTSLKAFGGFSTARGTQIVISEEASKASESIFAMFLSEDIPDDDDE